MNWRRLLTVPGGWAALFLMNYLIERPVLGWTAPLFGVMWIATAQLALHCLVLTAVGWLVGRLHREHAVADVLLFAATLAVINADPARLVNVTSLIGLIANTFRDSIYLEPMFTAAATQAFLFGCLIAGGLLSRPARPMPSIVAPATPS